MKRHRLSSTTASSTPPAVVVSPSNRGRTRPAQARTVSTAHKRSSIVGYYWTRVNYDIKTFRGDLFGGVTSTVVALPVALAFGIASGLGAAAGLYGAIAVGFFASAFGGTKSQISGPTPSMTVAMAVIVTTHASTLTEALTVVVLAGLLQVLLGLFKVGRFVAYTPAVVISGSCPHRHHHHV